MLWQKSIGDEFERIFGGDRVNTKKGIGIMQRRTSTQDVTWLLDLHNNKQLDLNPPYQRRSVWTRKDKQFFLDTIFRNYPSPAIFLHKTIDDTGKATYHVVDGKQRTETILDFVSDNIRMANNYGDTRLDGKKWSELHGELGLKQNFWNYQIPVEMIDFVEGTTVNEVFDRLNRNARKLTAQELRHAKFEGWFITEVETESAREEWKTLGVVTTARAKRMSDSQFISELMLVILEGKVLGFDQDSLDELYGKYDDPSDTVPELNLDEYIQHFSATKDYILQMNAVDGVVSRYAKGSGHFYALWAFVALTINLPTVSIVVTRYKSFMEKVEHLAKQEDLDAIIGEEAKGEYRIPLLYLTNSRGASTDLSPRVKRFEALQTALLSE